MSAIKQRAEITFVGRVQRIMPKSTTVNSMGKQTVRRNFAVIKENAYDGTPQQPLQKLCTAWGAAAEKLDNIQVGDIVKFKAYEEPYNYVVAFSKSEHQGVRTTLLDTNHPEVRSGKAKGYSDPYKELVEDGVLKNSQILVQNSQYTCRSLQTEAEITAESSDFGGDDFDDDNEFQQQRIH